MKKRPKKKTCYAQEKNQPNKTVRIRFNPCTCIKLCRILVCMSECGKKCITQVRVRWVRIRPNKIVVISRVGDFMVWGHQFSRLGEWRECEFVCNVRQRNPIQQRNSCVKRISFSFGFIWSCCLWKCSMHRLHDSFYPLICGGEQKKRHFFLAKLRVSLYASDTRKMRCKALNSLKPNK